MYGDMVVMNAVPAFMIIAGVCDSVIRGAIDIALGEKTKPREEIDLFADDQFLHRLLGHIAARILGVAFDKLDLMAAQLAGVKAHVQVHALLNLVAELGCSARIGENDANLDGLGLRGPRHDKTGCRKHQHTSKQLHWAVPPFFEFGYDVLETHFKNRTTLVDYRP